MIIGAPWPPAQATGGMTVAQPFGVGVDGAGGGPDRRAGRVGFAGRPVESRKWAQECR
jgi:hypothetical protein